MIRTLSLGSLRRARIWLGEKPALAYPVVQVLDRSFTAEIRDSHGARCAAIEIVTLTGGPSSYGLLGATYRPDRSGQLLVRVSLSPDALDRVSGTLAGAHEEVLRGLPSEFGAGVLDGASEGEEMYRLGSGVLCFNQGAHGLVGSSPKVFRWLARRVMGLLQPCMESASENQVAQVLR